MGAAISIPASAKERNARVSFSVLGPDGKPYADNKNQVGISSVGEPRGAGSGFSPGSEVYRLKPGRYWFRVNPPQAPSALAAGYANGQSYVDAAPTIVKAGRQVITLRLAPEGVITGTATVQGKPRNLEVVAENAAGETFTAYTLGGRGPSSSYEIHNLPAGDYTVTATPTGNGGGGRRAVKAARACAGAAGAACAKVHVEAGGTASAPGIELSAGGSVEALFCRPKYCNGLEGGIVAYGPDGRPLAPSNRSIGGSGRFILAGLKPGRIRLGSGVPIRGGTIAATVRAGQSTGPLRMRSLNALRAGSIQGPSVATTGPVFNASVTAYQRGKPVASTRTLGGDWELPELKPGRYTLLVIREGYRDWRTSVTVRARRTTYVGVLKLRRN